MREFYGNNNILFNCVNPVGDLRYLSHELFGSSRMFHPFLRRSSWDSGVLESLFAQAKPPSEPRRSSLV
ncbi:hypothetical protein DTO164E3_3420 [Paecilomyces variotii]|nr:hypothetical protein DTO032I3_6292 [Paecilomyces variotii]KAJ9201982.1 hypothetical protein DTO164E3_3420 [Paecilomyces variotii]KAJ9225124.1 hypothetical protein DTO169C6_2465 [Paecilomyces variotii]KAJ9247581.1 hypothetical protein DTO195F2_9094 [Paecilomyces variotii]KAJ9274961.1 hypothetical protein DTO021D3_8132 [Paecilomyces variotii]